MLPSKRLNSKHPILFNPKGGEAGGGSKSARWSGDRLPFLTGSCYGHKNSCLYPQTSQLEGTNVIF